MICPVVMPFEMRFSTSDTVTAHPANTGAPTHHVGVKGDTVKLVHIYLDLILHQNGYFPS